MVYFIQVGEHGPIKIGKANNPRQRLGELQTAHHETLRLIGVMHGDEQEEQELHRCFNRFRLRGEWFSAAPELLVFIRDNAMAGESDPMIPLTLQTIDLVVRGIPDDEQQRQYAAHIMRLGERSFCFSLLWFICLGGAYFTLSEVLFRPFMEEAMRMTFAGLLVAIFLLAQLLAATYRPYYSETRVDLLRVLAGLATATRQRWQRAKAAARRHMVQ